MVLNSFNNLMRQMWRSNSGNFGISFAILLPVLLGLLGGTIDFMAYKNQEADMQNVADAAVLAAAREGSLQGWTEEVAVSVAEQFALEKMSVSASVDGDAVYMAKAIATPSEKSISITLEMDHHPYFIMGYFKSSPQISVTSSASVAGEMNTCVIGLDNKLDGTVSLSNAAKLTAPDCAVYSNSISPKGFMSIDAAFLNSAFNCSAGGAVGGMKNYSTSPTVDCAPLPDPLKDRIRPEVLGCDHTNKVVSGLITVLNPGVYCGGIEINKSANVLFKPGVYVIKDGELKSNQGGISAGKGVTFYFTGEGSRFDFDATTRIGFSAPTSGNTAGILFYQDPEMKNTLTYEISSIKAGILLGTIYLPNGIFKVHANNKVGDESAYTVIVAKKIDIGGGADLVVNANYSATSVPVPDGLGPSKKIRLSK